MPSNSILYIKFKLGYNKTYKCKTEIAEVVNVYDQYTICFAHS